VNVYEAHETRIFSFFFDVIGELCRRCAERGGGCRAPSFDVEWGFVVFFCVSFGEVE